MPRYGLLALAGVVALASACSSSTSTRGSTPTPSASATIQSPSPSATPSQVAVVKTVTATVSGKSEALLANTQGFTLYYRTSDTLNSVCSGTCASVWPPLLLPSGTPGSSQPLPGTLSVETNANGRQVVYDGHPLYLFKNDSKAGDTTGQGVGGFLVTTPTTPGN